MLSETTSDLNAKVIKKPVPIKLIGTGVDLL